MTMEPYVYKYYEYLRKGKIMGLKCNSCSSYVFPPVATCYKCGSRDLTWTEMSGEGKLLAFGVSYAFSSRYAELVPSIVGIVKLKEGRVTPALITGLDVQKPMEAFERLPIDVEAEIKKIGGIECISFKPAK